MTNLKDVEEKQYEKNVGIYNYRVVFDDDLLLINFCNDFARNVIIFGLYNSSSFYSNNLKNSFLVLGEGIYFLEGKINV